MVEDYLTDRDQEEALRNWWRENWKWILAGVALGLGLLAAWQYWQTHRERQADQAAKLYQQFQTAIGSDLEKAERLLTDLGGDHKSSAYTQQGRLLLAKRQAEAGKFDEAIKQLQLVVDSAPDAELAQVARLRVARLLIQQNKHDDVLKLLDIEKAGSFAPQMREVRGDALVAKGDIKGAQAEYAAALAGDPKDQFDRATVELKLRETGGEVPAPAAAPAAAPTVKGES
jgi:predicted negative regulator of RcsB-dependent stress response